MDDLPSKSYAAGETVMREGDPGDCAYMVVKGTVEIFNTGPDGKPNVLAKLPAGSIFGEYALIDRQPRSASVRAIEPTLCLLLTEPVVNRILGRADPVIRALLHAYMRRLRTVRPPAPPPAPVPQKPNKSVAVIAREPELLELAKAAIGPMNCKLYLNNSGMALLSELEGGRAVDVVFISFYTGDMQALLVSRMIKRGEKTARVKTVLLAPSSVKQGLDAVRAEFDNVVVDATTETLRQAALAYMG
ncbi:MAG: cyclic nucleotide-binding domain-containing protein [Alphaproteobacteria bacterium]|nr:cyclic nucleotide-binding domain-containing protein [Alphaproteobacteria bacterium]